MPSPHDTYVHCDKLEFLPELNRENWLWESEWIFQNIATKSSVLQIGSCEGSRIVNLMKRRPDLQITGIEIDEDLHQMALEHFQATHTTAHSILGDAIDTKFLKTLPHFDYCICLNNTLGYIPDEASVISNMKMTAETAIISVYGENFTEEVAKEYFAALHLIIEKVEGDIFSLKDFGTVKRYTKQEISTFGGKITETPLGYFCEITTM